MTVRTTADAIWLEGRCLVEDAETVLVAIQQHPHLPVDVSGVERMHLAVVQVLFVLKPRLRGPARDGPWSRYIFAASLFGNKSPDFA